MGNRTGDVEKVIVGKLEATEFFSTALTVAKNDNLRINIKFSEELAYIPI